MHHPLRKVAIAEGREQLTEVSQQDLRDNENIITSSAANLHVRYESVANQQEIPPDQYRQYMRGLNEQQRSMVMFHRDWCKRTVVAWKLVEPYHVFLSGPGGVGKSHVIKLVYSDTLKLLKLSGKFEPDDVIALLTAPTGVMLLEIHKRLQQIRGVSDDKVFWWCEYLSCGRPISVTTCWPSSIV